MGKIVYPWSDSDTVHLMRIARDVADGYLGIDEALAEFNNGAEIPRKSLRALETKCHTMILAAGTVTTPKLQATIKSLKRMENRCRAERRRVAKMTQSNPFYGLSTKPRKVTKKEKLLKMKLAATNAKVVKLPKQSNDLEQRVAKLESMIEDMATNVSHIGNEIAKAFKDLF